MHDHAHTNNVLQIYQDLLVQVNLKHIVRMCMVVFIFVSIFFIVDFDNDHE